VSPLSLPDKVVALDTALEAARIPHAFGGAIALAYYAEPRATIDVDINIFAPPAHHEAVRDALEPLGVDPSRSPPAEIERDGQGRWWWERTPVDLFFATDPIHEAMARAVRTVEFGEDAIPILGPEHLVVCKAIFDRSKDWIDIEQVLAADSDLDLDEITRWLEGMVGGDDPRVRRIEELAAGSRGDQA
jgi:Nucleotidyl transferase AbiEii toxin, Type IV TA system